MTQFAKTIQDLGKSLQAFFLPPLPTYRSSVDVRKRIEWIGEQGYSVKPTIKQVTRETRALNKNNLALSSHPHIGKKVVWTVELSSVQEIGDNVLELVLVNRRDSIPNIGIVSGFVMCKVNSADYPQLEAKRFRGDLWIAGTIANITSEKGSAGDTIYLVDPTLHLDIRNV